jgi:hypothetical protein
MRWLTNLNLGSERDGQLTARERRQVARPVDGRTGRARRSDERVRACAEPVCKDGEQASIRGQVSGRAAEPVDREGKGVALKSPTSDALVMPLTHSV